jgi:hypothetical protein
MRHSLITAFLILCLSETPVASTSAAVVETPLLKMSLPGEWESRPEFVKEAKGRFAFYDKENGSLLYIERLAKFVSPQLATGLVTNMPTGESFWGEAPHLGWRD